MEPPKVYYEWNDEISTNKPRLPLSFDLLVVEMHAKKQPRTGPRQRQPSLKSQDDDDDESQSIRRKSIKKEWCLNVNVEYVGNWESSTILIYASAMRQ